MNDDDLITAYSSCDPRALDELATRHGPVLVAEFVRRGVLRAEADDGVQQVWMRVILTKAGDGGQRFDPTKSVPLLAWLLTIASRLAVDWLRRQGRMPAQVPLDEDTGVPHGAVAAEDEPVDAGLLQEELRDAIRACREGLPADQKHVLELELARADLTPKPRQAAWAEQNGLTQAEYTSRLHKARRHLAECLRRRLPDGQG